MAINRRKLEALAEAISHYSGYHNPSTALHAARNPGGLRGYQTKSHQIDEHGYRVFNSVLNGFNALLYDIEFKLSGKSRAQLKPEQTLIDLAAAYQQMPTVAQAWARFIRQALQDNNITNKTQLSYFFEEQ